MSRSRPSSSLRAQVLEHLTRLARARCSGWASARRNSARSFFVSGWFSTMPCGFSAMFITKVGLRALDHVAERRDRRSARHLVARRALLFEHLDPFMDHFLSMVADRCTAVVIGPTPCSIWNGVSPPDAAGDAAVDVVVAADDLVAPGRCRLRRCRMRQSTSRTPRPRRRRIAESVESYFLCWSYLSRSADGRNFRFKKRRGNTHAAGGTVQANGSCKRGARI